MKLPPFFLPIRVLGISLGLFSLALSSAQAGEICPPPPSCIEALLDGHLDEASLAPLTAWAKECAEAGKVSAQELSAEVERALVAVNTKRVEESEKFLNDLKAVHGTRLVLFQTAFELYRTNRKDEGLSASYSDLPTEPAIPEHLRRRIFSPTAVPDLVEGSLRDLPAKEVSADQSLWTPRDYAVKLRAELDLVDRMSYIATQFLRESGPRLADARAELTRRFVPSVAKDLPVAKP